jgi:hypothetical protein
MQKRFCHCGGPVWVNYLLLPRKDWRIPVFCPAEDKWNEPTALCPNCGRKLELDALQ